MLKSCTLVVSLALSSILLTTELVHAQNKGRTAIDWSKLQIPQGNNSNNSPTLFRERGPASGLSHKGHNKSANGKNAGLNVYASCVDTHGLIHGSNTRNYESCLGQTVGGRQQFVQDSSRGLMLMFDVGRFVK
jgi:hypothetical protein